MNIRYSSAILSCLYFLLVQGFGRDYRSGKRISSSTSLRILNGQHADPEEFRFAVLIQKDDTSCSGSVISNHFIMTAAHCLIDTKCSGIEIFPSTWVDETESKYHVRTCYIHAKYYHPNFPNDIGLLKISEDLLEDEDFDVIPLPAPGATYLLDQDALIVGWGRRVSTSPQVEALQYGDTYVIDWEKCNAAYVKAGSSCRAQGHTCHPEPIPRGVICTQGRTDAPPSVCYGDSGGPLVIDGVVAGISVRTIGTKEEPCLMGTPMLAMNVANFLPWIYRIIEPDRHY